MESVALALQPSCELLLTAAALFQVWRIVRSPRELLSPPTFVIMGFFFIDVSSYYFLGPETRGFYLSIPGYAKLVLLAVFALGAYLIGFRVGRSGSSPRKDAGQLDSKRVMRFALALLFVSAALWTVFIEISGGFVQYYSAVHGQAGAWNAVSAYVYSWQLFLFPATFLLFLGFLDRRASSLAVLAMFLAFLYLVANAYLSGSRGGWLRLMIMVALPFLYLAPKRRLPKRLTFALVGGILALVLALPYIRSYTTLRGGGGGVSVGERAATALATGRALRGASRTTGNLLVVAAAAVQSADRTDTLNYGLSWLQPLLNFVPLSLWPEKHNLAIFVNYPQMIARGTGWRPAKGSAFTGLASSYVEFGWLAPLVWVLFGWWGGRLRRKIILEPSWTNAGYLAAYGIGLLYLITQGINGGFYGWFYFALPVWAASRWCRTRSDSVATRVSYTDSSAPA